jgi:biopolymer transport protein ExbD
MPSGLHLDKRPEGDNEVVLGLDASGAYFLNGNAIAAETLEDHLRSIYATTHTEDKILFFRADKDLPYAKIQDAVEVARKAGVRVMAAITECKTRGSCATTP